MPATAPPTALAVLVEAWKVASRKTADSKPSRSTARKAIATSAHDVPSDMAPEAESSRSRLRKRACLLIHRTIAVTKATATRPITVSIPSCCRWGRLRSTRSRATPTPMLSRTAAPTPHHMGRKDAPLRRRNVAMIETMSAASRPSRRPITKVGSIGVRFPEGVPRAVRCHTILGKPNLSTGLARVGRDRPRKDVGPTDEHAVRDEGTVLTAYLHTRDPRVQWVSAPRRAALVDLRTR